LGGNEGDHLVTLGFGDGGSPEVLERIGRVVFLARNDCWRLFLVAGHRLAALRMVTLREL
jgi:hypothetical protein